MKYREHLTAVLDGVVAVLLLILALLARAWLLAAIAAAWGVVGVGQLSVARRAVDAWRRHGPTEDGEVVTDRSELDQHRGSQWGA
ncbi:MAG TPA: hypothetical protein VHO29_08370 [Marmoricola sp.]|nr:hypothetical protein [Marmoricola sp.]